jgi:hypothetical protein
VTLSFPAQIIIDWDNKPIWRFWFFAYFSASFVLLTAVSDAGALLTVAACPS